MSISPCSFNCAKCIKYKTHDLLSHHLLSQLRQPINDVDWVCCLHDVPLTQYAHCLIQNVTLIPSGDTSTWEWVVTSSMKGTTNISDPELILLLRSILQFIVWFCECCLLFLEILLLVWYNVLLHENMSIFVAESSVLSVYNIGQCRDYKQLVSS